MPGESIYNMTLQFERCRRQHSGNNCQDDEDNLPRCRRPPDISVKLAHGPSLRSISSKIVAAAHGYAVKKVRNPPRSYGDGGAVWHRRRHAKMMKVSHGPGE